MKPNSLGFLYPGQGAQQVGMGANLCETHVAARKRFDQADKFLGFSIKDCCLNGPRETLAQDLNAQLGIYTISTIVTDMFMKAKVVPDICTGYSSGFYAAAYASGCFDFLTGLALVRTAGKILLKTSQIYDGGMAVIFGLPLEQIQLICQKVGNVEVAIHNTPRQIVISGLKPGIDAVMAEAMRSGALDADWLPVATAYHSRFMADAGKSFMLTIDRNSLQAPKISLYSYTTTDPVVDRDTLINVLGMQLSHPVLWVDLIRKLRHNQIDTLVEMGPGTMLSRSIRWIDRHVAMLDTSTAIKTQEVIDSLSPGTICHAK
jgi:[acyl-carrier-protein] S-malonyltransferase